jgi:hypothetical protein
MNYFNAFIGINNQVTVEFTNRANGYEKETVDYQILADINERGLKPMPTVSYPWIHDKARAEYVAQMIAMDSCYGRNTYNFTLGMSHSRLEPGDIVTLTDIATSLSKLPVMLEEFTENGDEYYDCVAKYKPFGSSTPVLSDTYDPVRGAIDRFVDPGNAKAPLFFETPFTDGSHNVGVMTCGVNPDVWGGAYVWISTDDESYEQVGEVTGPARYGKTTSAMTSSSTSVTINLFDSTTQLLSVSDKAADKKTTLLAIGTEWMAYKTATLVSAGLRRGLYGSKKVAHAIGQDFLRYDTEGFLYPYQVEDIGTEFYIKLVSYNVFGKNMQSLDDVMAYIYKIQGAGKISRTERVSKEIIVPGWTSFTFDQPFNNVPSLSVYPDTVGSMPYKRNVTVSGFEALLKDTSTGLDMIGEFTYEAQGW